MGNWGPEKRSVMAGATDTLDIPCGGVATFYSRAVSLILGRYFAVAWKATSAAAVDLKLEYQMSDVLPAVEGDADANWFTPESASDIDTSLTDENRHGNALSPASFKYIRFKITGAGANAAGNTINIDLSMVEEA